MSTAVKVTSTAVRVTSLRLYLSVASAFAHAAAG
jgi:hypothetical protein